MSGTYLKMLMNVRLVGDKTIILELVHVNSSIHDWSNPILFISDDNFVIEKSNYFKYTPNRMILPYKVESFKSYIVEYSFSSETERYNRLKKLYRNLIKFSKCVVFKKDAVAGFLSNTLNLTDERWCLY